MKVLVDTNLLLSYLISPQRSSAAVTVVEQVIRGEFALVLPAEIGTELRRVVAEKAYFSSRIADQRVDDFIEILSTLSVPSPTLESIDLRWVRDPNDDYLVQVALLAKVDYLISGDKDLLALGDTLAPLKIRSPQAFLDEIRSERSDVVD